VRLVFSVAAGLLGWGVEGALAGFAIGAGSLFATRWRALRPDLAWYPAVLRESARWTVTGDVAGTQLVVSALVVLDVVLVARWGHGSAEGAGYAALATLTKGPIYVAVGTVLVAFPLLRSAGIRTAYVLRETLRSFTALALLAAVVLGTVPVDLLGLVLPAQYVAVAVLLPWMALSGLGYACVAMLSTILLALRAYRRTKIGLLQATVAIPLSLVLGWWRLPSLRVWGVLGAMTYPLYLFHNRIGELLNFPVWAKIGISLTVAYVLSRTVERKGCAAVNRFLISRWMAVQSRWGVRAAGSLSS